ncbi:MAG: DUF4276 family protein [Cytophagales bacterium]|nr:DUF4276 family protein [Cytophagales bacterium]
MLAKPESLSLFYLDKTAEINKLKADISGMSPEDINDSADNAPSKRIEKRIPNYARQKTTAGVAAAAAIGLDHLRYRCPHFNDWITRLESI